MNNHWTHDQHDQEWETGDGFRTVYRLSDDDYLDELYEEQEFEIAAEKANEQALAEAGMY